MTTEQLLSLLSIAGLSLACIVITILLMVSVIGYDAIWELFKDADDDNDDDIHKVNY
jgi:hypothetical protein